MLDKNSIETINFFTQTTFGCLAILGVAKTIDIIITIVMKRVKEFAND